jgi:16S rRNA (guanine1207-N2)-methyltransferase
MTKEALLYALKQVPQPEGTTLWLYGDASIATGDVYTPHWDQVTALRHKGCNATADIVSLAPGYDAVFVDCPKQKEETEGLIALAFERSKGFVMAVAANDAGGNRLEKLFKTYGVETHQLSKHHCKVVWTHDATKADRTAIARNRTLLDLHAVAMDGKEWWTVPGLFGWNKIDAGSTLLAEHLPADLAGVAADFGCGFGYLAARLTERCPLVVSVDAYDADKRSIEATIRNNSAKVNALWQDMRTFAPKPLYDVVVMNPPFHSGRDEDMGLGEIFIKNAWASLRSRGQLFMVANRNLPYEQVVPQLKAIYAGQGYKIMTGRKP